jgi:hypothetical protein
MRNALRAALLSGSLLSQTACGQTAGDSDGAPTTESDAGSGGNSMGGVSGVAGAGGTPMAGDAAVDARADVDSPPDTTLTDALQGNWTAQGVIGNCTNGSEWLSFDRLGAVTYRAFDENACYGTQLLREISGSYSVTGPSLLELSWNGDRRLISSAVARHTERFNAAVFADMPHDVLAEGVLVAQSATLWTAQRDEERRAAGGELIDEQSLGVELRFSVPLPDFSISVSCVVVAQFTFRHKSPSDGIDESGSGIVEGLPCQIEPVDDGQLVRFDALLGEMPSGDYVTWPEFLQRSLIGQQIPEAVLEQFRWVVQPRMQRRFTNPNVLASELGNWSRADRPVPTAPQRR